MITALVIFQVCVCVLLVALVLLQFGKGAEVGAIMGSGASQAVFSSSQGGNILTKATTACAILFMVNSIALTSLKSKEAKKSILDNEAPVARPLNNDQNPMNNNSNNEMNAAAVATATATATPATTTTPVATEAPKKK